MYVFGAYVVFSRHGRVLIFMVFYLKKHHRLARNQYTAMGENRADKFGSAILFGNDRSILSLFRELA